MTIRFMLVPIIEQFDDTGIFLQRRGPKYLPWPKGQPFTPLIPNDQNLPQFYEFRDFGLELTGLVAIDVTAAQLAVLNAQPDVVMIPANLDNNVGAGNLAQVQAVLENLHIPADAVGPATTYRQIVRGVTGIFSMAQAFDGLAGGRLFPLGIDLSTTLGTFSANVRGKLQQAATNAGYSFQGLTLTSTVRDVLKSMANQQIPQTMMGISV